MIKNTRRKYNRKSKYIRGGIKSLSELDNRLIGELMEQEQEQGREANEIADIAILNLKEMFEYLNGNTSSIDAKNLKDTQTILSENVNAIESRAKYINVDKISEIDKLKKKIYQLLSAIEKRHIQERDSQQNKNFEKLANMFKTNGTIDIQKPNQGGKRRKTKRKRTRSRKSN